MPVPCPTQRPAADTSLSSQGARPFPLLPVGGDTNMTIYGSQRTEFLKKNLKFNIKMDSPW